MSAYRALVQTYTKLHRYAHLQAIVSWDCYVNMPPNSIDARSAALAELSLLLHNTETSPELKELLEKAKAEEAALSDTEKANLREIQRSWQLSNLLPADLVERKSMLGSKCEHAWRTQRAANDWSGFLENFKPVLEASREEARLLAKHHGCAPYDALLMKFEPGAKSETISKLFADLKQSLPGLIEKVVAKQSKESVVMPKGPFPVEKQRELGLEVSRLLQFDFDAGRLDVSKHPFSGGTPEDVRMTTRYDESDFVQSLMGVIHETGHSRYEQNLPREWITQPVGRARSMGIHESQSLFFEMQLGRSPAFLRLIQPIIKKHLGDDKAFEIDNLAKIYSRVKPGYIRVDADELTYPLHVILRFEIEQALINGSAEAEDIPRLWQEKMKAYLNVDTEGNYTNGCLQDIHWTDGSFGYFPTYTLGAMYAAQYAAHLRTKRLPDLDDKVERGDFTEVFAYLKENIWSRGSILETEDLIVQATGEPLNPKYYVDHLEKRYLA
eukprot:PhM_4_TR16189/c0_g1_i1/m.14012/K01299/E3.4.17.19; carboxypeptidase Taq